MSTNRNWREGCGNQGRVYAKEAGKREGGCSLGGGESKWTGSLMLKSKTTKNNVNFKGKKTS